LRLLADLVLPSDPADAAGDLVGPMMAAERVGGKVAKGLVGEAAENFKRWFGDSKVVDEAGEPLRVYHGTQNPVFDTFDTGTMGAKSRVTEDFNTFLGSHFSEQPRTANAFAEGLYGTTEAGGAVYPTYLKIQNPYPKPKQSPQDYEKTINRLRKDLDALFALQQSSRMPMDEMAKRMAAGEDIGSLLKSPYDAEIEYLQKEVGALSRKSRDDMPYISEGDLRDAALEVAHNKGILPESVRNLHMLSASEKKRVAKAFKEHLQSQGHDGIRYKNAVEGEGYGSNAIIAFEPTQIKSATGNRGTYDPSDPSIMKSLLPYLMYGLKPNENE